MNKLLFTLLCLFTTISLSPAQVTDSLQVNDSLQQKELLQPTDTLEQIGGDELQITDSIVVELSDTTKLKQSDGTKINSIDSIDVEIPDSTTIQLPDSTNVDTDIPIENQVSIKNQADSLTITTDTTTVPTGPIVNYESPKTYEISAIRVTGTEYLNHNLLIENSGLSVGQSISLPGDEVSQAIRRLWKLGLFENIEIKIDDIQLNPNDKYDRKVALNINLLERPRVASVTFTGTTSTEEEDLTEKLELVKGKPITSSLKLNINKIISDYYKEKGFLNASSTFQAYRDTVNFNSSYLEINVDKGQRVKISNIVFKGNESIPDHELKAAMQGTKEKTKFRPIRPSDFAKLGDFNLGNAINKLPYITIDDLKAFADDRLSFQLFKGSKYIDEQFRKDKRLVIDKYNERGFRDAEVIFDTVYMADKKNAIVMATIDEGDKYYFRNITFKGNTQYSDATLHSILGIEKGDLYNETLLSQRTSNDPGGRDISSLYMDNGYLFFRAIPVEKAIVGDSVDVEIFVNEGKQATIDEIIIKGNDKTHEHVIRRELFTVPGDKFNRSDIIRSQQRIATMGFFDETQIGVRPVNINEATGEVDLEYTVVEKSNDQVQLQFGYGGQRVGLVGQLGLTLTNFSAAKIFEKGAWRPLPTGDGQRLSLNASVNSLTYQTYYFSFTEPWLGGKRANSLQTSFFTQNYNFFQNPFNPRKEEKVGKQKTTGAEIMLSKRLDIPDPYFIYSAGISYQSYDLVNSNYFLIRNGKSTNFALTQAFGRNSVNASFFPTGGSKVMLSVKFTPPWSEFKDASDYFYSDAEKEQLIAEENARRQLEGLPALALEGETIPADCPGNSEYCTETAFISDKENALKYELIEYHKWNFDAEWYQELGQSKFVLRPYASLGYLGAYNKDLIGISPFERFRFGGDGLSQGISTFGTEIISQRGYDDAEDYPLNSNGGYPIYNKMGLEIRYPLSGEGSTPIYALGFVEGGNAWSDFDEFDPFNLNRSAGIGVRLQLPFFGLIGFDYGVGFDKNLPQGASFGEKSQFNLILGVKPK